MRLSALSSGLMCQPVRAHIDRFSVASSASEGSPGVPDGICRPSCEDARA